MLNPTGLFIIFNFIGAIVVADRVVMTRNGPMQGITVATGEPVIEAFLGIPYAEPPVGRLRFLKPVPKTPWKGVLDASKIAQPCIQNVTMQYYYEPNIENMTEDCLHLNLWVPYSNKSNELKPIVIFIHGGGFNQGSSNMNLFDGIKLSQFGDVIVATINYRVGAMGFFSAFIEEANGNAGVFDQSLAIKWIWENAKSFGGNPDHIVLMGSSAGAICITSHLMSPSSKHMVKRAIMLSGSAILPFVLDDNAQLYKVSERFANFAGCSNKTITLRDDARSVVQCLKSLPPEKIAAVDGLIQHPNPMTFFPRVGDEMVPNSPVRDMKEGKFIDVELLIGINQEEGAFIATLGAPEYFGTYGVNGSPSITRKFAHNLIRMSFRLLGRKKEKEIADFYINSIENGTSEKYTLAISRSLGDLLINCAALFQAEIYSIRNPVYFYKFSRRASASFLGEWIDTTHLDDLQFVFGNPMYGNFTPEEEDLSRHVMARFLAFIKTGNPSIPGSVQWPTFKYDDPAYLDINDNETVHVRPDNYRCEFWRERFEAVIDDAVKSKLCRDTLKNRASKGTTNIILLLHLTLFIFLMVSLGVVNGIS